MKNFDGSNVQTVEDSIARYLDLQRDIFVKYYHEYLLMKLSSYRHYSFLGFKNYLQTYIDVSKLSEGGFDSVIFFHRTSVIDDGDFIKHMGLLPLNELIYKPSPISNYLAKKGIVFFMDMNNHWIDYKGELKCIIRGKSTTNSGACRPPIPEDVDH